MSTTTPDSLLIEPLGPCIGAVVRHIDLSEPQPESVIAAIRHAVHEHGVLFFRDQHHLEPTAQCRFAGYFGELEVTPFATTLGPELPQLHVLDEAAKGGVAWHTDTTYLAQPPLGSVLRGVVVPPGGDTIWSSMTAAYDSLSGEMRSFLEGLTAVHDSAMIEHRLKDRPGDARPSTVHPVVITDPVTMRRALYVNPTYTSRIAELSAAESHAVLGFLFELAHRPEFQVRLTWEPDTVAFWCNMVTQHYASPSYEGHRLMHRVSIVGPPPVFVAAEP